MVSPEASLWHCFLLQLRYSKFSEDLFSGMLRVSFFMIPVHSLTPFLKIWKYSQSLSVAASPDMVQASSVWVEKIHSVQLLNISHFPWNATGMLGFMHVHVNRSTTLLWRQSNPCWIGKWSQPDGTSDEKILTSITKEHTSTKSWAVTEDLTSGKKPSVVGSITGLQRTSEATCSFLELGWIQHAAERLLEWWKRGGGGLESLPVCLATPHFLPFPVSQRWFNFRFLLHNYKCTCGFSSSSQQHPHTPGEGAQLSTPDRIPDMASRAAALLLLTLVCLEFAAGKRRT